MNPLSNSGYSTAEHDEIMRGAMPDGARLDKFEAWLMTRKGINWREVYPGVVLSLVYELYRAEYAQYVLLDAVVQSAYGQLGGSGATEMVRQLRWEIEKLDGNV